MPLNAVIFDMDGVLFESEVLHYRAYVEALAPHDLQISLEWFRDNAPGIARVDVLRKISTEQSVDFDIEAVARAKGEAVANVLPKTKPMLAQGVREALAKLVFDYRLAVATSSTMGPELIEWAGLTEFFETIVTSAEVSEGKPAPDIYLEAARRLDSAPSECVVIEDSAAGIEGARRAGMATVGFALGSRDGLESAEFQASTFAEIVERVRSL